METGSALYQLMGIRMNGIMNSITNSDGQYQDIIRKSDEYSGKLEELELPEEVRLLIDRYVSEQNALGSPSLSSRNRSNIKASRHILPYYAPVYKGMNYSKTDLPWQTKNILIILFFPPEML